MSGSFVLYRMLHAWPGAGHTAVRPGIRHTTQVKCMLKHTAPSRQGLCQKDIVSLMQQDVHVSALPRRGMPTVIGSRRKFIWPRRAHLQHVAHEGLRMRAPRRVQHKRHARGEAAVGKRLRYRGSTLLSPASDAKRRQHSIRRDRWLVATA